MSTQITTSFVEQYKANILMLGQQKGSRLRASVKNESVVGKNAFIERIGSTAAVDAASRHDDTPRIDTPHSRRRLSLTTSRWADLIDNADKVRMLISPESEYAMNAVWAMGRRMDDHIITAASGNAQAGVAGATAVALPAAQKIAVNDHTYATTSGDVGLSLSKLLLAKEKLDQSEIDPEAPRFCVVNAKQMSELLALTEVQSADFNTVKALVQGQVDTFLGFTFIRSERIATDSSSDDLVLCYSAPSICLGVGEDIRVRISERDDKNYSVQVFTQMDIGATRVEDEGVVEIACDPS